jgi:hypothetical protein
MMSAVPLFKGSTIGSTDSKRASGNETRATPRRGIVAWPLSRFSEASYQAPLEDPRPQETLNSNQEG